MPNGEAPRGSADRLVHLLKLVAGGPSHFSLGDLAQRARLPASTVHRLLQVLLRSGLVERGPGQSYRPGRELHRLASQLVSRFDLGRSARPFLGEVGLPWGSLGRAILAHLPAGEIEAVFRETTTGPLTGRPRPSRDEFEAALAQVRADGFARYFDPRFDLAGIAAPIFGADREQLGCLGVTMPSSRYQLHLQDDLAEAVREGARELSQLAAISYS